MTDLHTKSPAFRQALLESERLRIYILLLSIAIILAIRLLRTVVSPTPENLTTLYLFVGMLAIICLGEFVTLRALQRARREDHAMRGTFWMINIVAEFLLPPIAIAAISSFAIPYGYRPLVNPSFLLYFPVVDTHDIALESTP